MQSSSSELVDEAPVDAEQPPPAPLIMIETTDDSGVCSTDGWCD